LLHEFSATAITDEIVRFLEDAKRDGLIGEHGIGSKQGDALEAVRQRAAPVVQTDWCALDAPLDLPEKCFALTHGSLRKRNDIARWIDGAHGRRTQLSDAIGRDLASAKIFNDVLLAAALATNGRGVVLLGSSRPERFAGFTRVASDAALIEAGKKLVLSVALEALDKTGGDDAPC